jgi:hypothetical protein
MSFIDRIDDVLTNAKGRHQATSGAKAFARSVKYGKPYYTIKTSNGPWGAEQYLDVNVFTKPSPITGLPDGAEAIWRCNGGNVYADRNAYPCKGLKTLQELTNWRNEDDGPDLRGHISARY